MTRMDPGSNPGGGILLPALLNPEMKANHHCIPSKIESIYIFLYFEVGDRIRIGNRPRAEGKSALESLKKTSNFEKP